MRWAKTLALAIPALPGTTAPAFSAEASGCQRTWFSGTDASLAAVNWSIAPTDGGRWSQSDEARGIWEPE
jgi:hypothetical protein